MTELESKIGYRFKDAKLLETALTTPSVRQSSPDALDNQRLEFLGDAVFGLLVADALYAVFPDEHEGHLSMRRTRLISGKFLASVAERIGLRKYLKRAIGLPDFPPHAKVLADAMEAVMGAVWLDGGIEAARTVFGALNFPVAKECDESMTNPRIVLQKIAQSQGVYPCYEIVSIIGPSHAPEITARVTVQGFGFAEAVGKSKVDAEVAAAAALLKQLAASKRD